MKSLLALLLVSLSACATQTRIIGPDGTPNLLIRCGDVEYCYEEARKTCGGKYTIVNSSSNTSSVANRVDTELSILVKCQKDLPKP